LKNGAGLFTLPCGKVLNFPSSNIASIDGWLFRLGLRGLP
jgi:hypothetical protein